MRVTKIEKKKRLYLLELDSSDKLYITEDTIVRFMLTKDKEISEQELAEIRDFAQFSYGKNLALYFISFKQRTKKEVADYLRKYEVDENTIPAILRNLEEENWVNDLAYAETYVRQNSLNGDKGPAVLRQKLQLKGLEKSLIDQALTDTDFSELAAKVGDKIVRKYGHKLPLRALQDKIAQGLVTKGFSYELAKSVVANLDLDSDEEAEADLLEKELDKQYRKYNRKYEGYELQQRLTQALARKGYDYGDIRSALRDYL
ncbi:recombination regulator RecX [Streptococcus suis]|nr:recombination regulator RecX [Streptococcus suis]NQL65314.1 recombination regulator RecX [Streptococcus suis]NQM37641.1 recombination regulator RecX [Streptococcus suis]NQO46474.1 recombination regulator RecX [Streptococcus suis]WNF85192.1 recombination regulator RecX [Streptococcus suis]